jgi:ubiquinone/menaquinone biosynthesis C-methylase UbiE
MAERKRLLAGSSLKPCHFVNMLSRGDPEMNPSTPNFEFMAAQLRKPSGSFAANIAQNMDEANECLYDLTLQSMAPKGDERLLEIGFGSGRFMPRLLSHRDHLRVNGIDYSTEMVAMAMLANTDLIQSGRLTLEEASSEHLPFEDGTFDVVFSNMVIYFWDNPADHLREVWRVLRPDGKFYTGFRPKDSMKSAPFVKFGFTLYEPSEWQTILEQNGFRVLRTDRKWDPEMEANGQKIKLESVCMVAQKQPR